MQGKNMEITGKGEIQDTYRGNTGKVQRKCLGNTGTNREIVHFGMKLFGFAILSPNFFIRTATVNYLTP